MLRHAQKMERLRWEVCSRYGCFSARDLAENEPVRIIRTFQTDRRYCTSKPIIPYGGKGVNPLLQAILGFARVPGSNAQPYITCVGTFIGIHQNLAIIIPQIVTGISLYRFLTGQQKTSSIEPGHSGDEGNDIASSIPIIMNTHDSGSHRHS